jgi:hypothetical protein
MNKAINRCKFEVILTYKHDNAKNHEQYFWNAYVLVNDKLSAYGVWKQIVRSIIFQTKRMDNPKDLVMFSLCYIKDFNERTPSYLKQTIINALDEFGGRVTFQPGIKSTQQDEMIADIVQEMGFECGYKESDLVKEMCA